MRRFRVLNPVGFEENGRVTCTDEPGRHVLMRNKTQERKI